ncbi:hypothetical protein DICVIV_08850 [Dictyocaulus viviparus]|uniref:Uncharacterized protein n=1 Tax=Dictyocaulus viviparus TaxID=29172 RepID=A0A0D8XKE7_DICVI|nr:hypothetical protein DICVIV_08850 [Dictyocaulus viviparus]
MLLNQIFFQSLHSISKGLFQSWKWKEIEKVKLWQITTLSRLNNCVERYLRIFWIRFGKDEYVRRSPLACHFIYSRVVVQFLCKTVEHRDHLVNLATLYNVEHEVVHGCAPSELMKEQSVNFALNEAGIATDAVPSTSHQNTARVVVQLPSQFYTIPPNSTFPMTGDGMLNLGAAEVEPGLVSTYTTETISTSSFQFFIASLDLSLA